VVKRFQRGSVGLKSNLLKTQTYEADGRKTAEVRQTLKRQLKIGGGKRSDAKHCTSLESAKTFSRKISFV